MTAELHTIPLRTVLLVDEDVDYVLAVREAVESAGVAWDLQVVADGHQAVAYLVGQEPYADRRRYPLPALALIGYQLPRKVGFGLLSWVRSQPGLRRLPVIVLASSNDHADVNRAFDLGANSYLVKPQTRDALVDTIKLVAAYWDDLNSDPDVQP